VLILVSTRGIHKDQKEKHKQYNSKNYCGFHKFRFVYTILVK